MTAWLKALNPTSPLTSESEAERAAQASAVSIFIGVIAGLASIGWSLMNPGAMEAAVAAASQGSEDAAAVASMGVQATLWLTGALVLVQLVLGILQWRNAGKFIAILFIVLLLYGIASSLAAPLLTASMPELPQVPTWQIVLSVVVMAVQLVLQFAGLRGIRHRDRLQFETAR
jgi:uncharacterized membrane protein